MMSCGDNTEQEGLAEALQLIRENPGYLQNSGWIASLREGMPVDAQGKPVPWITFPALDFISSRLSSDMAVFEYGSGHSTLWWSSRVSRVVSCEHDKEWYAEFKARVPGNVDYMLRRVKNSTLYSGEIARYRNEFDILVIDGRDRVSCIRNGLAALKSAGIVIWDNSDRQEYEEGYQLLADHGFKRLDFWGMGPLATRRWCTSIFYRKDNCIAI